jgi:predicted transcriptional regulator
MGPMSPEIAIVRALLRLARRRSPTSLEQLLVRVDVDARDIERALRKLTHDGLVHMTETGPRLTMNGFAIAVAMAAMPAPKTAARPVAPARVEPMVRRRRAA